jgi:hypothetical protein
LAGSLTNSRHTCLPRHLLAQPSGFMLKMGNSRGVGVGGGLSRQGTSPQIAGAFEAHAAAATLDRYEAHAAATLD